MSKYVISFEDNPWYQDECVGYYKCGEIPWWSAKKTDIKKLTPLDKVLDEAYKSGLEDGKARNENGCVGCKYDNERIDHAPCIYCCNAYSNEWMAKEKADEIKVGDIITDGKINYLVIDITDKSYVALQGTDFEPSYIERDYIKSYHNLHDPKDMQKIAEEITKAMKGEQRDCHTCKHDGDSRFCDPCRYNDMWQPKEGAE